MKKFLCFILVLSTGLSSCVKDVILDAKEEPQLVVECIISQDSVQTLQLSWTKGPSQAKAPLVTEAVAVLTDLTENREAGRFDRRGEGLWQLDYTPLTGHSYRLDVTVPGHEPVWAEQTVPEVPEIESVNMVFIIPIKPGDKKGLMYSSDFSHTLWAWAENYDAELQKLVPVDQICTDYPYVDNINLSGDVYDVSNWPFPGIPIESSLGYGYHEYCVYGQALHRRFLRFPKSNSREQMYFAVGGKFKGSYYYYDDDCPREPSAKEGLLYFASLSDEYDRYLCEAFKYYQAEISDDLTSIYVRDNVYSNIHGGVGIFGSYTRTPVRWNNAYIHVSYDGPDIGTILM